MTIFLLLAWLPDKSPFVGEEGIMKKFISTAVGLALRLPMSAQAQRRPCRGDRGRALIPALCHSPSCFEVFGSG